MPNTTNFGWPTPADTDLVKDGAAAIRDLGSGVDTSLIDLLGGTTGQVLTKASNTDLDFSFTTPSTSPLTTKGDLFTFDTAAARLAVGTNGQVLTADSGEATGLKFATPAAPATPSLALIASGTASGASLTISGLSSYDTIRVLIFSMNRSSSGQVICRINNNSTSNYFASANGQTGSTTELHFIVAQNGIKSLDNMVSGATNGNLCFTFTNCKAAGFTAFDAQSTYIKSGPTNQSYRYEGAYEVAEAVSSLVFSGSGSWSGSTDFRVYGA